MATYNHYNFTYLALESLYRNTPMLRDGRARLLIIDNNSTDDTPARILKDFPWVATVINSDYDCISTQWNTFLKLLKEDEDFCMIPNDVVFGPNWLELLQEDTYKYDEVIFGSPYMPVDLRYDAVVNDSWTDKYNDIYQSVRGTHDTDGLKSILNNLYGDFDSFCLDFQKRNENEPPIDCGLTHIMFFKNKLFKEHGFTFCEEYCPYYGSMEFDMKAELNNMGYYSISSSRSYVHHWISISNQDSNVPLNEKRRKIQENNIHLLQKWDWVYKATTFLNKPMPSSIPNHRTPYHKFKKRDNLLSPEEAMRKPGIKFINFEGLQPGKNYFDQIAPGSLVRKDKTYKVIGRYQRDLVLDTGRVVTNKEFTEEKWHIDYYYRREEDAYWGDGHMEFLKGI